jgi:SAM-dependent methyltransferase
MLADYLAVMEIDKATSVLDMGCGTGTVARTIAARPGFSGHVTGVDLSVEFIGEAERLAREEGTGERITFAAGDTRSLAFPDKSFDAVVAHTLISHVDDPLAVLSEARRLLRRGGTLAVYDADWASLTHEAADTDVSAIINGAPIGYFFAQPRLMRRLPLLAREAGLEIIATRGYVFAEIGRADYWRPGMLATGKRLAASGLASEAQAARWAETLVAASDAGEYFGSCNYYACLLRHAA